MRALFIVCLVVASSTGAAQEDLEVGYDSIYDDALSPPYPLADTPLELAAQHATFDCTRSTWSTFSSRSRVEWTIANPTDREESVTLEWYGHVVYTVGQPAPRSPPLWVDDRPTTYRVRGGMRQLDLTLPPHARVRVSTTGGYEDHENHYLYMHEPLAYLHPLLGGADRQRRFVLLNYWPWQKTVSRGKGHWARVGPVSLQAQVPVDWHPVASKQVDGHHLVYEWRRPDRERLLGGPIIGIGGTFGQGFRMRGGWELGFARHWFASVAADSNLSSTLRLATTADFAHLGESSHPAWVLLGIAIGGGLVGDVLPHRRIGARGELTLYTMFCGVSLSLDAFPSDQAVEGTLMARFSL